MQFLKRFGVFLSSSILSTLLVIFALSTSAYMVLDKPETVKTAVDKSGLYQVLVDNTLEQKQQQLSAYLPVDNPDVQKAVREAFPNEYLRQTSERNIDATYAWIHGETQTPQYQADLTQPKQALADNVSQVVEQKLASLPVCTKIIPTPTNVADLLALTCKPAGISSDYFVNAVRGQMQQSNVFNQVVEPVLTLKDEQGQKLTDTLSYVPKAYRYWMISLYVVPIVMLLCALGIIFWSQSKRQGAKRLGWMLLVTGITTVLLSLAAVWLLSKAVRLSADSSSDLLLAEGKIITAAQFIGSALRNWLVGIGAGYIVIAIILFILVKIKGTKHTRQNAALNKSLGYNDVPAAGTMYGPRPTDNPGHESQEPERPKHSRSNHSL